MSELAPLDDKPKALTGELRAAVTARGSRLMELPGIGPAGAARNLADVGDVARVPERAHFASWTGTAPIDASSGEHVRHRLSRAGNRRLNHVLHIAAVVQLRNDTPGRSTSEASARPARAAWRPSAASLGKYQHRGPAGCRVVAPPSRGGMASLPRRRDGQF